MSPALTPGSAARPWSWGSVIIPGGQWDAGGLLCSTFPKEKIGRCSSSTVPPRSSFPGPVGNGEEGAWHGMLLPCGAALGSPTSSAVPAGAVGSPGGGAGPCSQLFLVLCFWDLPSPFHCPFSTPWPAVSSLFCWIPVETVKNSAACSGKGIYLNAARQTPSFYLFWIWAFHLLISVFSTGRDKTGHCPVAFPFHFAFHRHLSYSPFLVLVPLCGSCSVPLPLCFFARFVSFSLRKMAQTASSDESIGRDLHSGSVSVGQHQQAGARAHTHTFCWWVELGTANLINQLLNVIRMRWELLGQ